MLRLLWILNFSVFLAVVGFFVWQSSGHATVKPDLRIVVTNWPAGQLVQAAVHTGYFAREGIVVDVITSNDSIPDTIAVMQKKRIDGGSFSLTNAVRLVVNDMPLQVVLATDQSMGRTGIAAIPSVRSVKELKGQRIALQAGGDEELLLRHALEQGGLSMAEIDPVYSSATDAMQSFLQGNVAAVVATQPYLGQSSGYGRGHVIYTASDARGLLMDVFVFRPDFVAANPEIVEAFLYGWFRMLDDLQFHEAKRREILAATAVGLGETITGVEAQLSRILWYSKKDNRIVFDERDDIRSVYGSSWRFFDLLEETEGQPPIIDVADFINPSFVGKHF